MKSADGEPKSPIAQALVVADDDLRRAAADLDRRAGCWRIRTLRTFGSSSSSPTIAPTAPPSILIGGPSSGGAQARAPMALRQMRASSAPSIQMPGAPGAVSPIVLQVSTQREQHPNGVTPVFVPMNAWSPPGPTRIAAVVNARRRRAE